VARIAEVSLPEHRSRRNVPDGHRAHGVDVGVAGGDEDRVQDAPAKGPPVSFTSSRYRGLA
jgi:hypothetical protein